MFILLKLMTQLKLWKQKRLQIVKQCCKTLYLSIVVSLILGHSYFLELSSSVGKFLWSVSPIWPHGTSCVVDLATLPIILPLVQSGHFTLVMLTTQAGSIALKVIQCLIIFRVTKWLPKGKIYRGFSGMLFFSWSWSQHMLSSALLCVAQLSPKTLETSGLVDLGLKPWCYNIADMAQNSLWIGWFWI